jgi:hypothetical protein
MAAALVPHVSASSSDTNPTTWRLVARLLQLWGAAFLGLLRVGSEHDGSGSNWGVAAAHAPHAGPAAPAEQPAYGVPREQPE